MNDQRNMILAIVLSALVLFGWSVIAERWFPTARPPVTKIEAGKEVVIPRPSADPAADGPVALRDRTLVLREAPRVRIDTPRLQGSLNLKGARVDDLVLKQHRETIGANGSPIRLFSPGGAKGSYFAGFGWTGAGMLVPDANTVWTPDRAVLTPSSPVTLRWDNGGGQRFVINLAVDENYMFTARQRVENAGAGAVGVQPYSFISRAEKSKDLDSWTIHVGPVGVFNGATEYGIDYDTLDESGAEGKRVSTRGGWLGFTDLYWLAALVPDQGSAVVATLRRAGNGGYQADILGRAAMLAPRQASDTTTRLFAGAKQTSMLEAYQERLGIPQFDNAIDWGWFEWFAKPIFHLLEWLFKAAGNFGVAIILLTLIVRGIMYPIASKQFRSMAAMRVLQPKMKLLQDRYKEDKPKLQAEMLKLYQTEKVNPLAGCAPILLQIPIFYALYKVLMLSVEMRHQPFIGWIRDLSAPDPLTPVNLFGMLAFTPPSFLAIGVLPILVGVTSYIQIKLNPPAPDPIQQQIFSLMPWLLIFVMAPFAAGLQLYWATNNILTIAQQKWLYRKFGMEREAAADAKKAAPAR